MLTERPPLATLADYLCRHLKHELGRCPDAEVSNPLCWRLAEALVAEGFVSVPDDEW